MVDEASVWNPKCKVLSVFNALDEMPNYITDRYRCAARGFDGRPWALAKGRIDRLSAGWGILRGGRFEWPFRFKYAFKQYIFVFKNPRGCDPLDKQSRIQRIAKHITKTKTNFDKCVVYAVKKLSWGLNIRWLLQPIHSLLHRLLLVTKQTKPQYY